MQTRYVYLLRYILMITDVIMLNLVYFASFYITLNLGKSAFGRALHQHYVVVCNLIWLFNTAVFGLYSLYGARKLERIYRATWRSVALHVFIFAFYLLLSKNVDFSRPSLSYFMLCLHFPLS
jgi:putative colanic acid biosynthesis UDP-glucose lipid carrier transferase